MLPYKVLKVEFSIIDFNAEVLQLTGLALLSLALLIMAGPALRRRIPNELLP